MGNRPQHPKHAQQMAGSHPAGQDPVAREPGGSAPTPSSPDSPETGPASTDTKLYVKRVEEKDGRRTFSLLGTALLQAGGQKGVIMTQEFGPLRLYRKDQDARNGDLLYAVKVVKSAKPAAGEEPGRISLDVGTFLVRPDHSRGTLFLHLYQDKSFPAFLPRDRSEGDGESSRNAA